MWKEARPGQHGNPSRQGQIPRRSGYEGDRHQPSEFRPNLQRVHVTTPNGTRKTMRVCTQCIRSGAVMKRIQRNPFKLPKTAEVK